MALADAEGVAAVTMRRLAGRLGIEAMSLYHHVARKEDLVDRMVDRVVGEIDLPRAGTPWRGALRATAIAAHDVLLRHAWAVPLVLGSQVREGRLRYMEAILATLRTGGFSPSATHHGYHALDSHIVGFTLWETGIALDEATLASQAVSFLEGLPRDRFPHVAEHVEQHLAGRGPDEPTEFEFGLELILDGLARLLEPEGGVDGQQLRRNAPPG